MLYGISLVIFVIICLCLIGIILLQASKSGGMGSAMGQQAMGAAFGGEGGDSILVKVTAGLASTYMLLAIIINLLLTPGSDVPSNESIISTKIQSDGNIIEPISISPLTNESDTTQ